MVVETLGFLIIIGALIYIVLRRQGLLAPFDDRTDLQSAEGMADKIRFEMEKSADEIINRLAEHIDRLENLISQAEEVSARLDGKLTRLRREIHAAQESGILPVMTAEQLKSAVAASPPVSAAARPQPIEPDGETGGMPETIKPLPYTGYRAEQNQEKVGEPESRFEMAGDAAEDIAGETEFAKLLDRTIEATAAAALDISSLPARNTVAEPEPPEEDRAAQTPKRIDYYARARELKEQQPTYPESGIEAIKPVEVATLRAAARVSAVAEPTATEEARRLLMAGYTTEDIAKKVHLGKGAIELLRQMGAQGR